MHLMNKTANLMRSRCDLQCFEHRYRILCGLMLVDYHGCGQSDFENLIRLNHQTKCGLFVLESVMVEIHTIR